MIAWAYEIRTMDNKLVISEGTFNTEKEALVAGKAYAERRTPNHPDEKLLVTAVSKIVGGAPAS